MANIVEQINDSLLTEIAAAVGSTFSQLDYVHNVEKNQFRNQEKRFGVRPLGGIQVSGVTREYTIDQEFELILTTDYLDRDGNADLDQVAQSLLLCDKMDDILVRILRTKVGIPTIVMAVSGFTLDDPVFIEEAKVVVQTTRVTVRYRQSLTL